MRSILGCAATFFLAINAFEGNTAMARDRDCTASPTMMTICQVEMVVDDVAKTYDRPGGGGISEIRQVMTDVWRVSIAQEEAPDVITYTFERDTDGTPRIAGRETE